MPPADSLNVLVFTATPLEHEAVRRHLAEADFKNIRVHSFRGMPGKVNAAFSLTSEIMRLRAAGVEPNLAVMAGTSGALCGGLRSGDMVVASDCVISDWQMITEDAVCHAPYGDLAFKLMGDECRTKLRISCRAPMVEALLARLDGDGFKRGTMLTSDSFVAGRDNKLRLGEQFGCLTCDMESGAFAYVAEEKFSLPWFALRVTADSLDEDLAHYNLMEKEMTDVLGSKLFEALSALDSLAARF